MKPPHKPAIRRGQFIQVPNLPPYQHPRAAPDYIATHGEVRVGRSWIEADLLFTRTEVRRALRRALRNREDVPRRQRASLLERIDRFFLGQGRRTS
ncbi:MAG TPA: hypothetical protein PK098_06700 [Phycisphaerales bacterium]|nr:hypothetical protein [Phycisphaerales bacterium]